jgi:hypothetical protein
MLRVGGEREVDPREQRRERGAIDLHLGRRRVERGELEAAALEPLGEHAPPRTVEPQRLRQAPRDPRHPGVADGSRFVEDGST